MKIVVYGSTETRPFIYTLLRILQSMGNTIFQTEDPHFKRLLEDGADVGTFENIFIAVTSDDIEEVAEYSEVDLSIYQNYLYDSIIPEEFDVLIYVKGIKVADYEELEMEDFLELVEEGDRPYKVITINYGFGEKCIPYSIETFLNIEKIEGYRSLIEVDRKLTKRLSMELQSVFNIPANTLRKLVAKKR